MIAEVIVDVANAEVDRIFDYIALEDTKVGQRVKVPFGKRCIDGYVIGLKETSTFPQEKLKTIQYAVDDFPVILPEFLHLAKDMIGLYHLRYVDCIRLFVPTQLRSKCIKPIYINYLRVCDDYNPDTYLVNIRANAKKQKEMFLYIERGNEYSQTELYKYFGAKNVMRLIDDGVLIPFQKQKVRKPVVIEKQDKMVSLTEEQQNAVNAILNGKKNTHLLFGVTGSGKTEVYMNIIKRVLEDNKTALLLVPEISLTPQLMGVFVARFGDQVALLHSGLSDGERFDEWQRIILGEAKIVIGARSSIFAPLTNIGAIILDEEHDSSYKSESNPRFLTHEVAMLRARYNDCPLVLGSATPSLDSYNKAQQGLYQLHTLTQRANKKAMPDIEIINMCDELKSGNNSIFSRKLLDELKQNIDSVNQSILFLNRRGFSSYVICKECGYVAKCEDCDVSLVYHKEDNQLKCHYCNRRYKALDECPNCHSGYIKMGSIGTQKVVEELQKLFPDVKILRLDVDTTKTKNSLVQILDEFAKTKPSILIGTQMIAKGHDFPDVTLVGILDADMSLHFSDYRAVERTFQLITQVAGRAGRAGKSGRVLLQTYSPNHYVFRFAQHYDYKSFFDKEINLRQVTNFPPFSKILRVLISGDDENLARETTRNIFEALMSVKAEFKDDFIYLSAMRSPISRIQGKHRYQILIKLKLDNEAQIISHIYDKVSQKQDAKLQVFVEINPSNMS